MKKKFTQKYKQLFKGVEPCLSKRRPLPELTLVKLLCILVLSITFRPAIAQKKITISGYFKDSGNGESLPGAAVSVQNSNQKAISNTYGFYSLSLQPGTVKLTYSYIGYGSQERSVNLTKDTTINIVLSPATKEMQEVVVTGSNNRTENVRKAITSRALSVNTIRQLPPLLGEADMIRSFQLMPGVSTVGEGTSGFNVRGGGVDQNLILLDEAPLYFTSHLFNLFSVTNPDAMKDAVLYKSDMPARFGGRLSSVLDTRMKDGNNQRWSGSGGLGLIASRFTIEGPIQKNKSSLIVSGRRSYTDLLTKQSSDPDIRDNSIYFYDLSAKANFSLGNSDRLFISSYFGKDNIGIAKRFGMEWGNGTGTLRWNHVFNPRLFSNTSLIYSNYNYQLGVLNDPTQSFTWKAGIIDYSLKNGFTWYVNTKNTMYFGFEATRHDFSPGKAFPTDERSIFNTIEMQSEQAGDYQIYWDHELQLSDVLSFEYGARYTLFQNIATGNTTAFDFIGEAGKKKKAVNPRSFEQGEVITSYHNLQPRFSMKLKSGENASVKASFSRTAQNMHLISNTVASSPLDIWKPSSYNIKPELSNNYSAGYFRNLAGNTFECSAEIYYRDMRNQLDFINNAQTLLNDTLAASMVFGDGRAYGAELFLKKNSGRLNGWISYTLSKAEKRNELQSGYYPVRFDKRHALSLVTVYELKPRISLSATYNFSSGTPSTIGDSRFEFDGIPVQYNSAGLRNNFRVNASHRLDVSATFRNKMRPGKKFSSEWLISLYNATNRRNPFSVYVRQNEEQPTKLEAVQFSVFGSVIPSVTWNFKF